MSWGYKDHNGPAKWCESFPLANGPRQSPVNIDSAAAKVDKTLKPIEVKYDPNNCLTMENTTSSFKVNVNPNGSTLTGGPLKEKHALAQFHAHWGNKNGCGSEHTLDCAEYDAELHLVHYNTKYADANVAGGNPDGYCVLGMFVKVGAEHPEWEKMCRYIMQVQEPSKKVNIKTPIDPANFLPEDKTYFTYLGSLTTPPLSEVVTWVVFKQPIEISEAQMTMIRNLWQDEDAECIVNNYRPPLDLGGRPLRRFNA